MRNLISMLLVVLPVPLSAQQPNREVLQRQILTRLIENYRVQAGLTEEQTMQFRQTFQRQFQERRAIEIRERGLFQALEGQLRPGVAADQDSIVALLNALSQARQEQVDLVARYQAEYATFLTPIQQGQLVLLAERFQRQIENLRNRANQVRR